MVKVHMGVNILDAYVTCASTPQAIVDIFAGEWSSKLPESFGVETKPSHANLFDDERIRWLSAQIGGFRGKRVLELGPLEGGHTYMIHREKPESITAIEANTRSFLKCLCIKEIARLDRAEFKLGDAIEYMEQCNDSFDVCIASGILYHSKEPLRFLEALSMMSRHIFIWTHYYDQEEIAKLGASSKVFDEPERFTYNGESYVGVKRGYEKALEWAGFCGGSDEVAVWLDRESLFKAVGNMGFSKIVTGAEHVNHPNGPAISLFASKE